MCMYLKLLLPFNNTQNCEVVLLAASSSHSNGWIMDYPRHLIDILSILNEWQMDAKQQATGQTNNKQHTQ